MIRTLGLADIDKSKVSHICKELVEVVAAFRDKPLNDAYPCLWMPCT